MFGYFKVAQIMSIIMFIAGLVLYLLPIRRPKLENLYKTEEKIEIVNYKLNTELNDTKTSPGRAHRDIPNVFINIGVDK